MTNNNGVSQNIGGTTARKGMLLTADRPDSKNVVSNHTLRFDNVINLTRHPVVVVDEQNKILVEFSPAKFSATIQGGRRYAPFENVDLPFEVPIVVRSYGKITGLPEQRPGTGYIVSGMIADAFPSRTDLLVPDAGEDALRDASGRVLAVRRLIVVNIVRME